MEACGGEVDLICCFMTVLKLDKLVSPNRFFKCEREADADAVDGKRVLVCNGNYHVLCLKNIYLL